VDDTVLFHALYEDIAAVPSTQSTQSTQRRCTSFDNDTVYVATEVNETRQQINIFKAAFLKSILKFVYYRTYRNFETMEYGMHAFLEADGNYKRRKFFLGLNYANGKGVDQVRTVGRSLTVQRHHGALYLHTGSLRRERHLQ
jgi:hypothetical protein